MNLKQLTHIAFPYALVIAITLAMVGTALWSDPMQWLEQVLAIERYWVSLIIYGLLMTLATVFAPLTIAVTIPFMAKIFGPFAIFVTSWVSWMVGAMIVFYLARRFGQPLVQRLFSMDRLESIQQKMPTHLDFWVLLLLRTFVPVDVLSYAVGLFSSINVKKYFVATALGIIPGAFIFSYGPEAITGNSPVLLFSFLALSLLIITALAIFYFSDLLRPLVKIYTHDGKFHTDDVFAVAVIQMVLDQQQRRYEIIRTRDETTLDRAQERADRGEDVFVVDVGGVHDAEHNQFDHHQVGGAGKRENGIEYASFGLVWQQYGARLCGNNNETAIIVDEIFGQQIDGPDNGIELFQVHDDYGVGPITMYEIIEDYYRQSSVDDPVGQFSDFIQAVTWAKQILPRIIARAERVLAMRQRAGQIYSQSEDRRIMISDDYVGRNYFVRYEETQLVVSPRTANLNGDWSVAVIPTEPNGVRGRVTFPKTWWGLRDEELQEVSGVSGAKFCHRSGDFICVANSKRSAVEMAQKTVSE